MKIGTRKSRLAVIQTELVADAIRAYFPGMDVQIMGYETEGDKQFQRSLSDFGGKGAFTQDIERAMLSGNIDLAVHSAKDMPLDLPEGLAIGAVLKREDARDMWISCVPGKLCERTAGTVAGTGSRRRALQAMEMNPGLMIKDIRGNVSTRLRKMSDGMYDGIILAAAGIKRLGYLPETEDEQGSFLLEGVQYYYEYLPAGQFLPAAGQGIIAVEARQEDCGEVLAAINDDETWLMMSAERAFLKAIGGSCNEAAAISTRILNKHMILQARYAGDGEQMQAVFGRKALTASAAENMKIAEDMGIRAAKRLLLKEEG